MLWVALEQATPRGLQNQGASGSGSCGMEVSGSDEAYTYVYPRSPALPAHLAGRGEEGEGRRWREGPLPSS